nr:TetR family transcriptional regulator [uncultured Desulfobulbus sp.]
MKTTQAGGSTQVSTREKIIQAAVELFAEKGLDATSMRDITNQAGVNLAAINYHFGSKKGLIAEVFSTNLDPLNTARLARLDQLVHEQNTPSLEAVLDAFIGPVVQYYLDAPKGNNAFMRLMSRCLNEPSSHIEHVKHHFDPLMERFEAVFTRALPDHSPTEIFWGLHFTIGTVHHTLAVLSQLQHLPHCPEEPIIGEHVAQYLIAYTAAGMRAQHLPPNHSPSVI